MQLGKYNRRILLQRPADQRLPSGQPAPGGWQDIARPWAWIKGKSGSEAVVADLEVSSTVASMRIRYRTDVDASWRVVYRGEPYDIKAVLPDEAGREHVDLVVVKGAKRGGP